MLSFVNYPLEVNFMASSKEIYLPIVDQDGKIIETEGMPILFENENNVIYIDGIYCYKVFKNLDSDSFVKERLETLMHYQDDLGRQFILPNKLYTKGDYFAYRSKYIPNAIPFQRYIGNDLLKIAYKVDSLLFRLHQVSKSYGLGIAFGDFHFQNVLLNFKKKPFFIDFDHCKVSNYKGSCFCTSFYKLINKFGMALGKEFIINQDTDKIHFYICLLELYFQKPFLKITMEDLDASEKDNLLFIRIYFLLIECFSEKSFKDVPYFHELLKERDMNLILHYKNINTR